jgi:hypothetical protein
MKKDKFQRIFLKSLWFPLVILAVFILETVLGNIPLSRLILILGSVVVVSVISIFISFAFSQDIIDLTNRTEQLQKGLDELYKHQAIMVSDQALIDIESRAKKIRIISPDLYDDQHTFYETVLANIKANKVYEYVIPDRPDLISKMDRLLAHLYNDTGLHEKRQLPIRYKTCSDYPIITEYVIYDGPEFDGLQGFVEIRVGSNDADNTNVPLNDKQTYLLNRWFDQLFKNAKMAKNATYR